MGREIVLGGLGAIGFALAFSWPILGRIGEAGFHHDWDLLWQLDWAACDTVTRHHQLPLWNPWKCGGMPLLAQSVTLHSRPVHAPDPIPVMHLPSPVQLFPAPHWLPLWVHSASHLPPGEQ